MPSAWLMRLQRGGSPLNVSQGLEQFASAAPRAVAVRDGREALNYAEINGRADRLSSVLDRAGLQVGDRIGVLMANRLEYVEVIAAIARAGMVIVPISPRGTVVETAALLAHARVRGLIAEESLVHMVGELAARDHQLFLTLAGVMGDSSYERALASAPPWRDPPVVAETAPFCISYTSGTTGAPKGVVLSHRSRCLTFLAAALEWGLGPGSRTSAVAPICHGAGLTFAYGAICTGGSVTMMARFDPLELLDVIERDSLTTLFLVPTHAQRMSALPEEEFLRRDLSSLRTIFFNAAALPGPLREWTARTFPLTGIHELYGSTEAGIMANLRPDDAAAKLGSVGAPWFMTEVRILDPDGQPVGAHEPGELYTRSPFLMNGYLDDEAATDACTTKDGFFSSGDLVTRDEDGFITIVGRVKDVIISGGINVYPREIEELLGRHESVREAAVVGVPDALWGERIVACLVLEPGAEVEPAALDAYCRVSLAGYKIPSEFRVVPALPRSASEKVLKSVLRESLGVSP